MIRYLKNKPPGKQTFLDRMLIDNHRLFQAINLTYHPFVIFATWGAHTHSIGGYFFGLTLAGNDELFSVNQFWVFFRKIKHMLQVFFKSQHTNLVVLKTVLSQ